MKKLTALDLQTALDECAEKRFKTHSDWLYGMVNRLNAALTGHPECSTGLRGYLREKEDPFKSPLIKLLTGNNVEPEVPCIS